MGFNTDTPWIPVYPVAPASVKAGAPYLRSSFSVSLDQIVALCSRMKESCFMGEGKDLGPRRVLITS